MKKYIIFLLFFLASFAEAQVISSDNFDTSAVANGVNIAGRRKWIAVTGASGLGGYMSVVWNSALMVYSTSGGTYGAARWDSVISTPSVFELTIDSVGATNGTSFYFYPSILGTDFKAWKGHRLKWLHNSSSDPISIEKYQLGNDSLVLQAGPTTAQLQRLDKIRMYEYGNGWRALATIRGTTTLDSIASYDTTFQTTLGAWAVRGSWVSTPTSIMHLDSMRISTLTPVVSRDTVPPVIASIVVSPTSPDSSQALTFTLHATDDYGLDTLKIKVGVYETGLFTDSLIVKPGTTKDTSIILSLAKKLIGNYIYNASAKDDSAHLTSSQTYQFSVVAKKSATYHLYDDFNASAAANIAGTRKKWKAMSSQPESTGVGFVLNTDSTASPTNTVGTAGSSGGVYIDSVINGRSVIGFIIKSKGALNGDISLFQRMNDTSWTAGDGYRLKLSYFGTGDDARILYWVNGAEAQQLVQKVMPLFVGDTIYFKSENTSNRLTGLVVGNGRRDSVEYFGATLNPSSYRVWLRGGAINPWKVDNVYLDTIAPPPPLPVTLRDTVSPVIYSRGLLYSTDTTAVLRARDEQSNAQYSSIPSHGLDTMGFAIYTSPVGTLVYQTGKKLGTTFDTLLTSASIHLAPGNYNMYSYAKDDSGNVVRDTSQFTIASTTQYWLTTYYSTWQMQPTSAGYWCIPPWKLDFTGITHVVEGGNPNMISTFPYSTAFAGQADSLEWAYGAGRNPATAYRDSLIKYAHMKGTKVLFALVCINSGGTAMNTITADSATTDAMSQRVAKFVQDHGYDGVDINWETDLGTQAQTGRLFRRMRVALNNITTGLGGRAVIHISPLSGGWGSYDAATANANVDQINPQLYDQSAAWNSQFGSNGNWYVNPLHQGTLIPTSSAQGYDTRGPLQWIAAGFSRSIMGAGIADMGRGYVGSDTLYGGPYAGQEDVVKYTNVAALKALGYVESYDAQRHAHAIHGTGIANYNFQGLFFNAGQKFWYTFQDPRDVPDQVQWVKDNNLGGVMLYDMTGDLINTNAPGQTNPTINAFISALGNSVVVPAPTAPVPVTITGDPNNQPITTIHLFWSFPANSQTFNFLMGTDSTFLTNISINAVGLTDSSIVVGQVPYPSLIYGTKYYWKVQAVNSTGSSAYSTVQNFTTIPDPTLAHAVPPAPLLVTPLNNATGQATSLILTVSKLNSTDTVSTFHILFSTDSNFVNNLIVNDSTVSAASPTKAVSNLSQGTIYYWKARAKNNIGWSAYSTRFKLTTAPAGVTPVIAKGSEIVFDAPAGTFSIKIPTQKTLSDVDPAFWTLPDSGTVGWYGRGFMLRDGRKFDLSVLSGSGQMTYSQIITELNKTSPVFTNYWTFNSGLTASYAGTILARFDANGSYLSNLSVNGNATFSGGIPSFTSGLYTTSLLSDATFANPIIIGASNLNFTSGTTHTITTSAPLLGNGSSLTIQGQSSAANGVPGDLFLQGAAGNVSGNGGNVVLSGGAIGGGAGSVAGKVKLSGNLQYQNGKEGAGKILVADATGNLDYELSPNAEILKDDFMYNGNAMTALAIGNSAVGPVGSTKMSVFAFSQTAGGGGVNYGTPTVATADSTEPGLIGFTLGSCGTLGSANGGAFSFKGSASVGTVNARMNGLVFRSKFYLQSLADSLGVAVGLMATPDTLGFIASDSSKAGLYVYTGARKSGSDTIWAAASNGTKTKVYLGSAIPAHWYKIEIQVLPTSINYSMWSDLDNFATVTTASIVTNLPTNPTYTSPFLSAYNFDKSATKVVKFGYYSLLLGGVKR